MGNSLEVTASLLYQHSSVMDNDDNAHWKGRIAINPDDDEIMIIPKGYGYSWFSDDAGGTWAQKGLAGGSNTKTQTIRCVQYHPEEDTWWALRQNDGGESTIQYSTDKTVTWTSVDISASSDGYRGRGFFVASDGTLYSAAAGASSSGSDARIWKRVDPKGANIASRRILGVGQNGTHGVGIIGGVNVWAAIGGVADRLSMTTSLALTANKNCVSGTAASSDRVASNDDYVLSYTSNVSGFITLSQYYYSSSTTPPTITYDFGFNVGGTGLYYGNGRFVLLALSATEVDVAYASFMDETTLVWYGPYRVQLPVAFSPTYNISWGQLIHYRNNEWLFGYNTGTYGVNNYGTFVLAQINFDW